MASKKVKSEQVKDVSTLVKFFFTLGVLAVLLFIGLYFYAKLHNSPSAVVDEYVSGFMAKSPSRLFRSLDLQSTRFITPDRLDTMLDEIANYDAITSYSLVKLSEDENLVYYQVNYMTGRIQSPFSQVLVLRRTEEKYLFFFDKWVIDSSDLIASHVTLRVPPDATLKVDNVTMTPDQVRKKTKRYIDYDLGRIFIGRHSYEVTLDGFRTYTGEFTLKAQDYYEKPVESVATGQLTPDEESKHIVKKLIARIVPKLYELLLQRRSYDFFLNEVAIEPETREDLRARYDAMRENYIDTRTHLTYVKFGHFKSKVKSSPPTDGCYALCVDTTVPYTTSATVVLDEDSPELKTMSGKLKIRSIFHFSDGQWWLHGSEAFGQFVDFIKE